jgi:peptide/nickel transport system substrate-binding protein
MIAIAHRALLRGVGALAATGLAVPALAASERVQRLMPQVDLVFLEPHHSMTNVTWNHGGLVFDQLYGTDSKLQVQPQMAEGHAVEEDGKRWRIRLREGLRFHDGEPVLARDCAASIKRWGRRDVLGVEILRISDEISDIDDRTLEFRLKQPFPKLSQALGKPGAYMPAVMPQRLAETESFKQLIELDNSDAFEVL